MLKLTVCVDVHLDCGAQIPGFLRPQLDVISSERVPWIMWFIESFRPQSRRARGVSSMNSFFMPVFDKELDEALKHHCTRIISLT